MPPKQVPQEAKTWVAEQGYTCATSCWKIGKGSFSTAPAEFFKDGSAAAVKFSVSRDRGHAACQATTLAKLRQSPHTNVLLPFSHQMFADLRVVQIFPCAVQDLQSWLEKRGVEPALASDLGLNASAGLAHLHRCEILHRDIRPGNMLIFLRPQPHLKLQDCSNSQAFRKALRLQLIFCFFFLSPASSCSCISARPPSCTWPQSARSKQPAKVGPTQVLPTCGPWAACTALSASKPNFLQYLILLIFFFPRVAAPP